MIASYLHNFIFIKTRKTAGTAAEIALSEVCGPNDIVTPLGPVDELSRGKGKALCRNFTSNPAIENALIRALVSGNQSEFLKARRKCEREFYAHMPASEIKERLPAAFWDRACKITAERHPYEKAVSRAYNYYRAHKHPPFPQYFEEFIRGGTYATYPLYTIDGVPVVDEFLRQETLYEDLRRVGAKLGFEVPKELARPKTDVRKDKRPAREILSDEQKGIVYEFCRPEFELLGYER